MKSIYSRLLSCLIFAFSCLSSSAQISLWVGQTYKCDATSSVVGLTTDISWSSSGGVSMSGAGFYRDVEFPRYEGGTVTVKCSWKYRLYSNDSYHSASKTWTFTCKDNKVSIYPTSVTIAVGDTYNLSYSHQFSNDYTHNANAYFYSSSPVISVTKSGLVHALSVGTGYVDLWSDISSVTPSCKVTVVEPEPTGVQISASEITLIVGSSKKLTASMVPSSISSSYSWISENPSVATVDNGLVTAVEKGTTRIKVISSKGNFSAYCKVIVKNPPIDPTSVSLPETGTIIKGFSSTLYPSLLPIEAETKFSWKSDNPIVISIDSVTGKITGQDIGTANITVTTANGLEATCSVSVVDVPEGVDIQTVIQQINNMSSLIDWTFNNL